jgi:hypothetical protein
MLFLASTLVRVAAMLVLVRLPARAVKPRPIPAPTIALPRGLERSPRPFGIQAYGPHVLPEAVPVPIRVVVVRDKQAAAKHAEPLFSGR